MKNVCYIPNNLRTNFVIGDALLFWYLSSSVIERCNGNKRSFFLLCEKEWE